MAVPARLCGNHNYGKPVLKVFNAAHISSLYNIMSCLLWPPPEKHNYTPSSVIGVVYKRQRVSFLQVYIKQTNTNCIPDCIIMLQQGCIKAARGHATSFGGSIRPWLQQFIPPLSLATSPSPPGRSSGHAAKLDRPGREGLAVRLSPTLLQISRVGDGLRTILYELHIFFPRHAWVVL